MRRWIIFMLLATLVLGLTACKIEEEEAAVPTAIPPDYFTPRVLAAFAALPDVAVPEAYTMNQEMIDLGRMLYYENRISISQTMSCNSCHPLDNYGVDNLQFSFGHDGQPVGRNSPTVYNAALHISQFWDGRAADVEEQAQGPILAAGEMGMPNPEYVIKVLRTIPGYLPLFEVAFPDDPDPINYDNVGRAIGAFERHLMTPDRFDKLIAGDESVFTEQEKRGVALFVSTGCSTCHFGPALGGTRYAVLGQVEPFPGLTDMGRFDVTGEEIDKYVFKVPSLRNIAKTGPYLHDGSVTSLEEMIDLMAVYQLGQQLTDAQITDIAAFLNALTGEIPRDFIVIPEFPASGPDTPGPYEAES
ncbi:MAG: c-type cytochrome [Anaerolineae bacterium]|nr:c-type cytochrome [Anaerolineae bacterium]